MGKFLTGEDGKTLYTFKKDTTPGKSACTGDCATNWPPFTVSGSDTVKPGDGVTGTLATISRPDGTMQVTYNGAPLYYFAADKAAGDTNGQGVGGDLVRRRSVSASRRIRGRRPCVDAPERPCGIISRRRDGTAPHGRLAQLVRALA